MDTCYSDTPQKELCTRDSVSTLFSNGTLILTQKNNNNALPLLKIIMLALLAHATCKFSSSRNCVSIRKISSISMESTGHHTWMKLFNPLPGLGGCQPWDFDNTDAATENNETQHSPSTVKTTCLVRRDGFCDVE